MQGIRRIGGKEEVNRKQICSRFREHYADADIRLQQLIVDGTQKAEDYCHALKGVSGNIGAVRLFNCKSNRRPTKQGQQPEPSQLKVMQQQLRVHEGH